MGKGKNTTIAPNYLYKYKAFPASDIELERLERVFTKNVLYFANPTQLNDPFDIAPKLDVSCTKKQFRDFAWNLVKNSPHYKGLTRKEKREAAIYFKNTIWPLSKAQSEIYEASAKQIYDSFGILCLTEKPDNILMWSHYANGHRGVCLQFKRASSDSRGYFGSALKVNYTAEHPVIKAICSEKWQKKQIVNAVITKSNVWEYESEWRVVDSKGNGEKKFGRGLLSGVILGIRITPSQRNIIEGWVNKLDPKPRIYQALPLLDRYGVMISGFKSTESSGSNQIS